MEDLPKVIRRRVKALKKMQTEHVTIEAQYQQELNALDLKYDGLKKPLYLKRETIINGTYEPNEEECAFVDPEDEDEDDEEDEEADADAEDGEDDMKGVPQFWLQAFRNCSVIDEVIEEHDVDVLRHLLDVRIDYAEDGKSFTIVFEFEANEFFTDTSLTKKYFINLEPEEGAVVFDGPSYEKAEGCKIAFKAGKDVRVKTIQKTQRAKKGSKAGKTRTVTRTEPQPSFFRFFEPPQQPDEDAELTQEQEMALDQQLFQDFEMADYIKDKLVPRAVLWFTGEALDYEDPTEDDEEDEEGLDGDYGDDESDDPDYVPPEGGGFGDAQPECKQS